MDGIGQYETTGHKKTRLSSGFLSSFWTLLDVLRLAYGAQGGTRTPTTCVATTSR
jgi:hypothetical protein